MASLMEIVIVGLNHRTAPVEVRERVSYTAEQAQPRRQRAAFARDSRRNFGVVDLQSQRGLWCAAGNFA